MNKLIFLLAIAGIIFAYQKWPRYLPQFTLTPAKANTTATEDCFQKPKCVMVYVAPWCPACQSSVSVVKELKEHWKDSAKVGLITIVGSDLPEKLEAMATGLGNHTFVDVDKSFSKAAKPRALPTWIVVNNKRKILQKTEGTIPVAGLMAQKLGIE